MNDDVKIRTHDWVRKFIQSIPEDKIGMTGPQDWQSLSPTLITQAFVHRTHMQIFDPMYPFAFPNWYMDFWLMFVYGPERSGFCPDTWVSNSPHPPRYGVDRMGFLMLPPTLQKGCLDIANFLKVRMDPDWDQFECTSTYYNTERYSYHLNSDIPFNMNWNYNSFVRFRNQSPIRDESVALVRTASGNDFDSVWEWVQVATTLKRRFVLLALDDDAAAQLLESNLPFFYEPENQEYVRPVPATCREGGKRAIAMLQRALSFGMPLLYVEQPEDLYRTDFVLKGEYDMVLISSCPSTSGNCLKVKTDALALQSNKKNDLFLGHLIALMDYHKSTLSEVINRLTFHSSFTPLLSIKILPAKTGE